MTDDLGIISEKETRPLAVMLNNPVILKRFELACGRAAGSVMTNIFTAAAANPEIWDCEPMSVINAALDAATLGLSISSSLGQACILPYKKWKKEGNDWTVESIRASFVPMKRGLVALAMETERYRVLNPFTVYAGQTWVEDQMSGKGHIEGIATHPWTPIGYGAYLVLTNGFEATDYMTKEEIMAHVIRYSPSWDKKKKEIRAGSKWATDFDMMSEGAVLKRLIRTKGVISTKARKILDQVEEEIAGGERIESDPVIDAGASPSEPEISKTPRPQTEEERLSDLALAAKLSPIYEAIRAYEYLCVRADNVKVPHEPLPEKVTIDQCREMHADLLAYIKQAEAQAKAAE